MDDTIRRAAALATVEKMYKICEGNLSDYHDLLVACFTDLPPAQQWILCSRELPKEEERSYWVCMEDGYQKQCRWKRYKGKDCYIYAWHSTLKVVAWMPLPQLPEPWKGEQE